MRSVSRIVGCSFNTVAKLLCDAGTISSAYLDEIMRDLPCRRLEVDELWSFCYAKDKTIQHAGIEDGHSDAGSVWTWTAICADTRLMPTWRVGDRTGSTAVPFMRDLSSRLRNRVQLTTDGHKPYLTAVEAFDGNVDYAQLVKEYGGPQNRYQGCEAIVVSGAPKLEKISTSYAERSNLTIRMGVRRYTRKTNAFSKRIEAHAHMVALWHYFYNMCRPHKSLGRGRTPAMAAGVATAPATLETLIALIDERAPKPNRPKTYKKRTA